MFKKNQKRNFDTLEGGYLIEKHADLLPEQLAFKIRHYLDILFGTIYYQSNTHNLDKYKSIKEIIPGLVDQILQYNNITFLTIKTASADGKLFEPVWFDIDLEKNQLTLYTDSLYINEFCKRRPLELPIVYESGKINLQIYNQNSDIYIEKSKNAYISAVVIADHVAQHIINSLYNPSEIKSIHENWTKFGFTLHSLFDLTTLVKDSKKIKL